MRRVIDLQEQRRLIAVKRAFRNWENRFHEGFGPQTHLGDISLETLSFLAQAKENSAFYLYELIMEIKNLGSGFEFNELKPKQKMAVIDQYLFLLDRIRFECMKRLGWLQAYPGEEFPLVTLVEGYDRLAPGLQANIPVLREDHPDYHRFVAISTYDKEAFIRKLIPGLMKALENYATIL
ncbi:MAG: hypothetical protein R6U38_07265 [Desulfatiglandaceae bacterium]